MLFKNLESSFSPVFFAKIQAWWELELNDFHGDGDGTVLKDRVSLISYYLSYDTQFKFMRSFPRVIGNCTANRVESNWTLAGDSRRRDEIFGTSRVDSEVDSDTM